MPGIHFFVSFLKKTSQERNDNADNYHGGDRDIYL
jgi:hypothetical protein